MRPFPLLFILAGGCTPAIPDDPTPAPETYWFRGHILGSDSKHPERSLLVRLEPDELRTVWQDAAATQAAVATGQGVAGELIASPTDLRNFAINQDFPGKAQLPERSRRILGRATARRIRELAAEMNVLILTIHQFGGVRTFDLDHIRRLMRDFRSVPEELFDYGEGHPTLQVAWENDDRLVTFHFAFGRPWSEIKPKVGPTLARHIERAQANSRAAHARKKAWEADHPGKVYPTPLFRDIETEGL